MHKIIAGRHVDSRQGEIGRCPCICRSSGGEHLLEFPTRQLALVEWLGSRSLSRCATASHDILVDADNKTPSYPANTCKKFATNRSPYPGELHMPPQGSTQMSWPGSSITVMATSIIMSSVLIRIATRLLDLRCCKFQSLSYK